MVFKQPTVTKANAIVAVANKLTQVLREEADNNIGVTETQKLIQQAENFQRKTEQTPYQLYHTKEGDKHTCQKKHAKQRVTNFKKTYQKHPSYQGYFCSVTNKNKQHTHINSQEDEDQEEANTYPANNTKPKVPKECQAKCV